MEYLNTVCFLHVENLCGIQIFQSTCFLVVFPKMSGIVNSSQYCYFNSLIQCLSNISCFQGLLEEHTSTLEQREGMKMHYSVNIQCK